MNMNRRDFTGTVLAGVASAMNPVVAQESKQADRIDTHQHLWDLDLLSPAWLKRGEAPLGLRYWEEEYEKAIGKTPFKAVFMEIDMGWQKADLEADVILKLCRGGRSRTRAAILGGDPARAEFGSFLDQVGRDSRVRGFRRVLHSDETPKGYGLGAMFLKHVRRVGELGKTFDLCMRPTELGDAVQMARECPDTRFVVDHCGNGDAKAFAQKLRPSWKKPAHGASEWSRQMEALSKLPNVYCKISGVIEPFPVGEWETADIAPVVNFCLDAFGADRVVFGSNWPVCLLGGPLTSWVSSLEEILSGRSVDFRNALWSGNARRIYRLPADF
jgi:L-fuconolactonase